MHLEKVQTFKLRPENSGEVRCPLRVRAEGTWQSIWCDRMHALKSCTWTTDGRRTGVKAGRPVGGRRSSPEEK